MAADWFQDELIGSFLAFLCDTSSGDPREVAITCEGRVFTLPSGERDLRPALNNPATKGWLLHMLREATGCADLAVIHDGVTWETMPMFGDCYATEGEALAAALLAVWGPS